MRLVYKQPNLVMKLGKKLYIAPYIYIQKATLSLRFDGG